MTAAASPDLQGWTIWETIANTIEDDELTVYLILDEAHRGFNTKTNSDKPTIVRRLVNGHDGYPPIPIVWGISATIERFKEAMAAADADQTRRALPPVTVDGIPRSGVRARQGHGRPRHPGRGGQLRHGARATRREEAARRRPSAGRRTRTPSTRPTSCGRCWSSKRRTRRTPTSSAAPSTRSSESSRSSVPTRCATCSASTPRRPSAAGRSTGSSRSASRKPTTCESSSPRTRSRPAGTARAPR